MQTSPLRHILLCLMFTSGCAGAKGSLTFDHLNQPVAMGVIWENPKPGDTDLGYRYEPVGELHHEVVFWGMVYSVVSLTGDVDVSEEINKQVELAGGHGVVLFVASSEGCWLNYVPILSILPFWPGCTKVTLWGRIVKKIPYDPDLIP